MVRHLTRCREGQGLVRQRGERRAYISVMLTGALLLHFDLRGCNPRHIVFGHARVSRASLLLAPIAQWFDKLEHFGLYQAHRLEGTLMGWLQHSTLVTLVLINLNLRNVSGRIRHQAFRVFLFTKLCFDLNLKRLLGISFNSNIFLLSLFFGHAHNHLLIIVWALIERTFLPYNQGGIHSIQRHLIDRPINSVNINLCRDYLRLILR